MMANDKPKIDKPKPSQPTQKPTQRPLRETYKPKPSGPNVTPKPLRIPQIKTI